MGGDHGPGVVVPAALEVIAEFADVDLVLVGSEPAIEAALERTARVAGGRIAVRHASQSVEMDDSPSQVLRSKRDSSMRIALDLVKDGGADACVSAGNTGALMATARLVLKTLPGIDRPAIVSALPTMTGHTHVLDLGANVESTPPPPVRVRGDGIGAGQRGGRQPAAERRAAQHRAGGHQGQRAGEGGGPAHRSERPPLHRIRRGRRHLSGYRGRHRLRRVRRERRAEVERRGGADDLRPDPRRVRAYPGQPRGGNPRASGAQGAGHAHGPAQLQRSQLRRLARDRDQEPRKRGRRRLQARDRRSRRRDPEETSPNASASTSRPVLAEKEAV